MGPSRMVTGALLEREGATERLDAALARAREGRGSIVLVEGLAGVGKTSVVAWARTTASAAGMEILSARGGMLERDFAFGIVRQLFEPALAMLDSDEREELLSGAAEVAGHLLTVPLGGGPDEPLPPDASFAVLHSLYWLTANMAARHSLCLTVDDAHWADLASLGFLAFLAARIDELPAVLVVAARPDEAGQIGVIRELSGMSETEHVRLSELSEDGVRAYLAEHFGAEPDREFALACRRATGGNPFVLSDLAVSLDDAGTTSVFEVERLARESVGRWLLMRLERRKPRAARLARALAILENAALSEAAAFAGMDETEAEAAAAELAGAQILASERPLRFVHPLARAGVYEQIPHAQRSLAHREAARLLASLDAPAERVAGHLHLADPAGDDEVVATLLTAARAASAQGAPESAVAYLQRALAEPPADESMSLVLLELGAAEANLGRADAVFHLEAAVSSAASQEALINASLVLAHTLLGAGRYEQSVRVLNEAAAAVADNPQLRSQLEVLLVGVAMHHEATAGPNRARIDAVRALADEPGASRDLQAVAGFIAVFRNEHRERPAALARAALAAPSTTPLPTDLPWFNDAMITLLWTEFFDEATDHLNVAIESARRRGDAALFAASLAYRGWASLRRGHLAGAEADSRTALEAQDLPAPALYRTLSIGVLAATLIERGQAAEAQELLEPLAPLIDEPAGPNAFLRLVRGTVEQAEGHVREALSDYLAVGEVAAAIGASCPSIFAWRSYAAVAHKLLGNDAEAQKLALEEVALARAFGAPRALGVALRAAGIVAGVEGEQLLREAIATLGGARLALDEAYARLALGAALRRQRRRRDARVELEQALVAADEAGATVLSAATAEELAAAGAVVRRDPIESRSELTASELRVARQAVDGRTNREIAQALFVTERTIEVHLSNAYRKLNIRSRSELAAALASRT